MDIALSEKNIYFLEALLDLKEYKNALSHYNFEKYTAGQLQSP
ncbi:MAG: hypothetical protein HPY66_3051 [Firmicutes bacterium]|nr:hypothetical protein [Bacillota bacterium]